MSSDALSAAIAREAADLIRLYDFSEDASVSLLSESENKVYLVNDPGLSEKYVIRINSGRLSYHTQPSIASEMMWMMALRKDTNIVVPKVLSARDGSLVQTISASDLDKPRHAAVYSFLSGIEPPEEELIPGFERLGEISAHMHLHAGSWVPPTEFRRHTLSPENVLDDKLNWGPWQRGVGIEDDVMRLLSRLENTLRRRLGEFPTGREYFGLIHADLRLANLLVDGEQTAIIDFDDCGFGWYLFDLAAALSFLEERPDVPELIASWLMGYRKVARITPEYEAEIQTFIMLRRLSLIGWVGYQQQHLEFARSIGSKFTTDSCLLAQNYLQRFG